MNMKLNELVKGLNIHFYEKGTDSYAIRVLGRGENLFFQKNNKAYLIQIDAIHGVIYSYGIQSLDKDRGIRKAEKEQILPMILFLYQKFYEDNATIIHTTI